MSAPFYSKTTQLWWLAALAIVALYVAPLAFRFPLLDPDEGLHASIAQEMVERGEYVTPTLTGRPFYDKPILYFWLQAAAIHAFGMEDWVVRLPGLACGVLGGLTTGLIAGRWWGKEAAPLATLLYLTMVAPVAMAQAAVHDVALVPWVNLAMWSLSGADAQPAGRARWGGFAAAGVWLAFATLTKGLVGGALVGATLVIYLTATRRWSWGILAGLLLTGTLALSLAAPWYFAMHKLHPDYLRYYFIERHVRGFATSTQRHGGRPWWYYLPILLGGSLPWALDVAGLFVRHATGRLATVAVAARAKWWLVAWLLGELLLLSAASSKLWTYCLPLFPPLAILAAIAWLDYLRADSPPDPPWHAWSVVLASSAFGSCVLPVAMWIVARKFQLQLSPVTWIAGVAIGASLVVWRILWFQRRAWWALAALLPSLAAHFYMIMLVVVPAVAANLSSGDLARYFNERGDLPSKVIVVDDRLGSLVFYLRPALRKSLVPGQIETVLHEDIVADPRRIDGALVVVSDRVTRRAGPNLIPPERPARQVGRFTVYEER